MNHSRNLLVLALVAGSAIGCQLQEGAPDANKPRSAELRKQDKDKDSKPKSRNKDLRAIQARADALAAQGADGIALLGKEVREGDRERKVAALVALGNLGPDAASAVDSIIPVLKSEDLRLKVLAIETLTSIGPKAKAAIPALIEAGKETKDLNGSFSKGAPSNVAEGAITAIRTIDVMAMPRLAEAMIPGLLGVVEEGRPGPTESALSILRDLGPHVKPALPRLKELLAKMPRRAARDALPVFLATGEEGMAILADFMLDPKTNNELKIALMEGYRWTRQTTPSTNRMLLGLLQDRSPAVRAAAVKSLQTVRSKDVIPKLVELLGDESLTKVPSDTKGENSYYVARALGNQGKDAVAPLIKALDHSTPLVRLQATRALALLGKDAQDAVPALEKLLDDARPIIKIEAAMAILKSGKASDRALEKLGMQLQTDSPLLGPTLEAISQLGPAARPLFPAVKKTVLQTSDYRTQRTGFGAIENMQADPKEIVRIWTKLLKKDSRFLSFPPAKEIRAHRNEAQAALPVVLELLKDPDVNTRRRATEVLAAMGPAATEALPALIKALDDRSFVAHGAMEALGAMAAEARPAVPALVQKFDKIKPDDTRADSKDAKDRDGGGYEKSRILTTLERIGPGAVEAVPRLVEWLPENPMAARVLGKIGPDARAAVPSLEKQYRDKTGYSKYWSAFALVKITGKKEPYVSFLVEVFQQNKDTYERQVALEAIVELGADGKAALPALIKAVKEKGPPDSRRNVLRRAAASALGRFGPDAREAVPSLMEMLKDSDYAVKVDAAAALGAIGPSAREAIPALEQLAKEDEIYRRVVDAALAKIRGK